MLNTEKIRELLKGEIDKGYKRNALAKHLGIAPSSLFAYTYGTARPDYEALVAIARYFRKPISYFFEGKNMVVNTPCSASPVCQELCAICEGLSDYWKHELLEYAQFIHFRHF